MLLEEYDEKAEREYLKKETQALEREKTFELLLGMIEDEILTAEQAAKRLGKHGKEFLSWYQKRKK